MTTEEFSDETTNRVNAIRNSEHVIVEHVRGLPAVLKDAGRLNSAEELQALLFLVDAQKEELEKHLTANRQHVIQWLNRQARPRS